MLIIATPDRPVTIYYCKANLKTGLTVRVVTPDASYDCRGARLHRVGAEIIHGNSTGKPKASGARCVLTATSGTIELIK